MDCPVADTRNRYEGRGSGDRIARLKALATRQGPAPTVQNSESWNLTKQQGCCLNCRDTPCNDSYDLSMQVAPSPANTYTFTGISSSGTVEFTIAQLVGPCVSTAICNYTATLYIRDDVDLPEGLTVSNATTCGGFLKILAEPSLFSTSSQITLTNIDISYYAKYVPCNNSTGTGIDPLTIILNYT